MTDVSSLITAVTKRDPRAIARAISLVENGDPAADLILTSLDPDLVDKATVIGITGPPGAGKSTLTDKLVAGFRKKGQRLGIIAVDPSSPLTGGAILGDRIRMMDHASDPEVVMRSMATRGRLGGLCAAAGAAVRIMAGSGCSTILVETVGVGQSEMNIVRLADITALVIAPGLGDDIQAMKAGLLEVADLLVINKADRPGAEALALDMEIVAREKAPLPTGLSRVCKTTALENLGINHLLEMITSLDLLHRDGEEHQSRRRTARAVEIIDWALEILRPELQKQLDRHDLLKSGDPRLLAATIIAELANNKTKES